MPSGRRRGDACVARSPHASPAPHAETPPVGATHASPAPHAKTPPVGATHASPAPHAKTPPLHPERPQRRSIRLQEFDYAQQGAYFVTICTQNRMCLFGEIVNGEMRVNDLGRVAQLLWEEIPAHFPQVETDAWVVMPNHVHGILVIAHDVRATHASVRATHASPLRASGGPPKRSLGVIVGSYKSAVAKRINQSRRTPGASVWQRNYYDHVIRDDADLNRIRQYILDNPAKWSEDRENPDPQPPRNAP